MENKVKYGIVGLITLLLGFGGNIYLTHDQLDNAYFCSATNEVGIFYGGISETGLTAYPYSENRTDYKRCSKIGIKGTWIPLKEYVEEQDLDVLEILNQKQELNLENHTKVVTINYPKGVVYECYFNDYYENNSIKSESECIKR